MSESRPDWEAQQKRTFTNWANERLRGQTLVASLPEIVDISAELGSGVHLVCLMNALFPQNAADLRQFKARPRNEFEKKINIEYALNLAEKDGVRAPITKVSHFVEVCFPSSSISAISQTHPPCDAHCCCCLNSTIKR